MDGAPTAPAQPDWQVLPVRFNSHVKLGLFWNSLPRCQAWSGPWMYRALCQSDPSQPDGSWPTLWAPGKWVELGRACRHTAAPNTRAESSTFAIPSPPARTQRKITPEAALTGFPSALLGSTPGPALAGGTHVPSPPARLPAPLHACRVAAFCCVCGPSRSDGGSDTHSHLSPYRWTGGSHSPGGTQWVWREAGYTPDFRGLVGRSPLSLGVTFPPGLQRGAVVRSAAPTAVGAAGARPFCVVGLPLDWDLPVMPPWAGASPEPGTFCLAPCPQAGLRAPWLPLSPSCGHSVRVTVPCGVLVGSVIDLQVTVCEFRAHFSPGGVTRLDCGWPHAGWWPWRTPSQHLATAWG